MLEFKNVKMALGHNRMSQPVSVIMEQGEMVCVCGARGCGKSRLLMAVMGLAPVADGFITIDGEQVGTGSASYLRRLIAYVPQRLPDNAMRVSELCDTVLALEINRAAKTGKEAVLTQWQKLNLSPTLYDCMLSELEDEQLQTILISLLPLTRRPIILIDSLPDSENVYRFVHELAQNGAEVLYTCEHQSMPCDKLIKL